MGRPRNGDVFFIGKEKSGVVSLSYFILPNPTLSHPYIFGKTNIQTVQTGSSAVSLV